VPESARSLREIIIEDKIAAMHPKDQMNANQIIVVSFLNAILVSVE
jgi:hypothetical protein